MPPSPDINKIRNISDAKIELPTVRKYHAQEVQVMKKFSIPEFSPMKRSSTPESHIGKRILSQDISPNRKTSVPFEQNSSKKQFIHDTLKSHTPDSPADKKVISEHIAEIPSFGSVSRLSRSTSSSGDRGRSQSKNQTNRVIGSTAFDRQQFHTDSSSPNDNSPLQSAPPDVDQKKRQFSFTPDDQKTIAEESYKYDGKASGSSSSHSMNSHIESPEISTTQQILQSQMHLYSQEKTNMSPIQRSISPKHNFSSNESLPQDVSGSPPSDSVIDSAKVEITGRRKPPNKFLKRAQSFSQFLKKKPTLPTEKRKKSGDGSRDDYYLPVNHEQLEEAQGEMMLVPVEKLVAIADLTADRSE